jgi:hypothetical protein
MEHRMPLERFEALLDIHGADFTRWPIQDARAAEDLLSQCADARAALERAQALDSLLDLTPVPPLPSADLAAKILAARPLQGGSSVVDLAPPPADDLKAMSWTSAATITAQAEKDLPKATVGYGGRYLPAAALAASLVLGILSGVMVQKRVSSVEVSPTVSQLFALTTQVASLPLEMRETIE